MSHGLTSTSCSKCLNGDWDFFSFDLVCEMVKIRRPQFWLGVFREPRLFEGVFKRGALSALLQVHKND